MRRPPPPMVRRGAINHRPALLLVAVLALSSCTTGRICPDGARWRINERTSEGYCVDPARQHLKLGRFQRHGADGGLVERGAFDDAGRRTGQWRRWWPSGQLRWQTGYRDGRQHGPWKAWSETGKLTSEGSFVSGKRDGPWQRWRSDGSTESIGRFVAGQRHGSWREYHPDGSLAGTGRYVDGQRVVWREFRPDGRPRTPAPVAPLADADACLHVVARAQRHLTPQQFGVLAGRFAGAQKSGMTTHELRLCRRMLADDELFMELLESVIFTSP